mgnify:FL=1
MKKLILFLLLLIPILVSADEIPGGLSSYPYISTGTSVDSVLIKTGQARLFCIDVQNSDAAPIYLKFYNKATAPTVGTDAVVYLKGVPATDGDIICLPKEAPKLFPLGMGIGITTSSASNSTAAVGAGDVTLTIFYK